MDVLLIRPPRPPQAITVGEFMYCEPLGLEAVFGVLKKTHSVALIDMMAEEVEIANLVRRHRPACVGLTSLCIDVAAVLAIAASIKAIDSKIAVVVGGTQAQLCPHAFVSPHIDYVMTQATAAGIKALFTALVGKKSPGEIPGVQHCVDGFTVPDRIVPNEYLEPDRTATERYRQHYSYFGYRPCALLQTSQGCSQCCRFCLRWRIEGAREHHQAMATIFRQLGAIREPSVMIVDNDFLCDGDRLEQLCDFLEAKKIAKNFICYGSVNSILKNQKSVQRFARHGLKAVLVGYESFSDQELSEYNKHCTFEKNLAASRMLRSSGVDVWASFIVHPDWSHADFRRFRKTIRVLRPEISSISPLTPFPGLPYYERYRERLLFSKKSYEKWSFGEVTIRPLKMSLGIYYLQILLTNLYINFLMNNGVYLVRKFGCKALVRLFWGSLKLGWRYIALIIKGAGYGKSKQRLGG